MIHEKLIPRVIILNIISELLKFDYKSQEKRLEEDYHAKLVETVERAHARHIALEVAEFSHSYTHQLTAKIMLEMGIQLTFYD